MALRGASTPSAGRRRDPAVLTMGVEEEFLLLDP